MQDDSTTRRRIKEIIVESLNLETIAAESIEDDTPLWGDGLGLDSVDALELIVALEKEYGIAVNSEEIEPEALGTVAGLAAFVGTMRSAHRAQ
jgi:acyl carrier protein